MSAENVELVRELYLSLDRDGRFADALLDDEVEYVNPPDAVEPGIRRGREEFRAATTRVEEAFGETRVEVDRLIDAGEEVVALVTFVVKGSASGVGQRQPQGHVWTFRDRKAIRFRWFNDQAAAQKAAGLEP